MPYLVFPSEVMELPDSQPTDASALDFLHLWSLMSYPDNEAAQERLVQGILAGNMKGVIEQLQAQYGETHEIIVSADLVLQLLNAPNAWTEVEQSATAAAFAGTVAGIILGWTIFQAERSDTRASASLGNAFRMVEKACRVGRWRGGGSENLKKHIWPTFRPVANFWAALHIWNDEEYGFSELLTPQGLGLFLIMAEWLRKKGEAFTPMRGNVPILKPEQAWQIRPEVSRDWPSFDIRCDNLEAWDLRKRIKMK